SVNHPLAWKDSISLNDLHGEKVMMIQKGDTIYIDHLRQIIEEQHPEIELIDVPLYDIQTFNQCEKMNIIMISAAIWQHVHPLLVTIPLETNHFVPYGIVYGLNPPKKVHDFISAVKEFTHE
ncbi:MAG: LysR family transcriptional regulator, partial [Lachnospiraceae bacterium]|nr:LysR family transcriptional regulator [Lachnospiraceae bacterium]